MFSKSRTIDWQRVEGRGVQGQRAENRGRRVEGRGVQGQKTVGRGAEKRGPRGTEAEGQ